MEKTAELAKKAASYVKFMQELFKKENSDAPSPMQLKGDAKKKFFEKVKKLWDAEKAK